MVYFSPYGQISILALSERKMNSAVWKRPDRRLYLGGSDAKVIMGDDYEKLIRLWREKRGEIEPEDLSKVLVVQLGIATEDLNRRWFERTTGHSIKDVQRHIRHPVIKWMAATLDGLVEETGAVFEAKFMLPWTFSQEIAAEKHMAQLQHNMWVANARSAILSIITGGGKWAEMTIHADPLYQHLLLTAEKKFWRCVQNGEAPRLFGVEPPRARLEAVRVVDMSASNSWAELASIYQRTREAYQEHESAKSDLKKLVPEDAKEAMGHGIRAKRSKSGAVSFELADRETANAQLQ
jgi:predicted phage-related endonuclease